MWGEAIKSGVELAINLRNFSSEPFKDHKWQLKSLFWTFGVSDGMVDILLFKEFMLAPDTCHGLQAST